MYLEPLKFLFLQLCVFWRHVYPFVCTMMGTLTHDRAPIPRKLHVPDVIMSCMLQGGPLLPNCLASMFVNKIGAEILPRRLLAGRSDAVRRNKAITFFHTLIP